MFRAYSASLNLTETPVRKAKDKTKAKKSLVQCVLYAYHPDVHISNRGWYHVKLEMEEDNLLRLSFLPVKNGKQIPNAKIPTDELEVLFVSNDDVNVAFFVDFEDGDEKKLEINLLFDMANYKKLLVTCGEAAKKHLPSVPSKKSSSSILGTTPDGRRKTSVAKETVATLTSSKKQATATRTTSSKQTTETPSHHKTPVPPSSKRTTPSKSRLENKDSLFTCFKMSKLSL